METEALAGRPKHKKGKRLAATRDRWIVCLGVGMVFVCLLLAVLVVVQILVVAQLHAAVKEVQNELEEQQVWHRLQKGLAQFEKLNVSAVGHLITYAEEQQLLQLTIRVLNEVHDSTANLRQFLGGGG